MPWQLEPDNQVWGYVWPLRNTGRKTDLHQICSEQVDATKVQTRRKSLTKMVTASHLHLNLQPHADQGEMRPLLSLSLIFLLVVCSF